MRPWRAERVELMRHRGVHRLYGPVRPLSLVPGFPDCSPRSPSPTVRARRSFDAVPSNLLWCVSFGFAAPPGDRHLHRTAPEAPIAPLSQWTRCRVDDRGEEFVRRVPDGVLGRRGEQRAPQRGAAFFNSRELLDSRQRCASLAGKLQKSPWRQTCTPEVSNIDLSTITGNRTALCWNPSSSGVITKCRDCLCTRLKQRGCLGFVTPLAKRCSTTWSGADISGVRPMGSTGKRRSARAVGGTIRLPGPETARLPGLSARDADASVSRLFFPTSVAALTAECAAGVGIDDHHLRGS
jgi:hypothetical protein